MTARAAPLVKRLAMLYAVLDCSTEIGMAHLSAAVEVWTYCEASVRFLFGDAIGDATADAIRGMLTKAPGGLTQTEISRAFSGKKSAAELDRALGELLKRRLIHSQTEKTGGAPVTRWYRRNKRI